MPKTKAKKRTAYADFTSASRRNKKQKSRSCNRGYPCGGSCISRGYNCRKKLTGQADNYANWLKSQGENLGDKFNQEAGKRISSELNQKLKINKTTTIVGGLKKLIDDIGGLASQTDKAILRSDRAMLEIAEKQLKRHDRTIARLKRDIKAQKKLSRSQSASKELKKLESELDYYVSERKQTKLEIKNYQKSILEMENQVDNLSGSKLKNQIKRFTRPDTIDKALFDLNNKKKQMGKLITDLEQVEGEAQKAARANQIVPFKKKRTTDFTEDATSTNLFARHQALKIALKEVLQEIFLYFNAK